MNNFEEYFSKSGKTYFPKNATGKVTLPVLNFLWGRKFDDVVFKWIHSLRPSKIRFRVVEPDLSMDWCSWRVNVFFEDDKQTIKFIEQEVEVIGSGTTSLTEETGIDLDKFYNIKW